ncbi:MAG: type II toxin-antitoxin system RelE/ParE family toxin [Candidatus Auribacterota bacterium]|nr:type II toxin-antitoxin system RelE/ParE family toxin [Candidatus Auribacterota bacterium]
MWDVITTDKFDEWFNSMSDNDRANILAIMLLLEAKGPALSRPYADTVEGSRFSNMKELRIQSKGKPLRVFFTFDPKRKAILLCAGNKSQNEKRFYKKMIPLADKEYQIHLNNLEVD